MKTIGILGGLGPQATMDFEQRIHSVSQQLIPASQNKGYPTLIVHYCRHAPMVVTEQDLPATPIQPDPRLLKAAKHLSELADFIVIPSNGVHMFQKEIEQAAGRKVVSLIDATLNVVQKRGWKKVGVVALRSPGIYTTHLKDMGIAFETIDASLQEKLDNAIFKLMEGREDEADRKVALEAIQQLRGKKVDGIIPGCTEIPLLLGVNINASDVLNPAQILAEAAVRFSIA